MDVCLLSYVLSSRGLCDELLTRPEESYRLWCVVVRSRNLVNEEVLTSWWLSHQKQTDNTYLRIYIYIYIHQPTYIPTTWLPTPSSTYVHALTVLFCVIQKLSSLSYQPLDIKEYVGFRRCRVLCRQVALAKDISHISGTSLDSM